MTITQLERERDAAFSELRKSCEELGKGRGYKLAGKTSFQGLPISIEQERGSYREGTDANGKPWRTFMHMKYGAIRGTEGSDNDGVDCYIGNNPFSEKVFIVHQNDPKTGRYDEDKCLLGMNNAAEAKAAYLRQYDDPRYFGSMDQYTMAEFKKMLKEKRGVKLKKSVRGYDMTRTEKRERKAEKFIGKHFNSKADRELMGTLDTSLGEMKTEIKSTVLERVREAIQKGKMSLLDAGICEHRVNMGKSLDAEHYRQLGMKVPEPLSKSSMSEQMEPFGVPVGSGNLAVNQPAGGVASQETTRATPGAEPQQRQWSFTPTASGREVRVTSLEVLHASHKAILAGKQSTVEGGVLEQKVNRGAAISEEELRRLFV